jgi:hypothetical protein
MTDDSAERAPIGKIDVSGLPGLDSPFIHPAVVFNHAEPLLQRGVPFGALLEQLLAGAGA